jgi:uncharacterized protein (TIGR03437 family)
MANFRLPPGLARGWSPVRLRFADSAFGNVTLRIAVDQPLRVERLDLKGVCDGTNWNAKEVKALDGGFISCWVTGLPENCDRANVGVYLAERKLLVQYVGEPDLDEMRQINAALPAGMSKGEQSCHVECGGVSTETRTLRVV